MAEFGARHLVARPADVEWAAAGYSQQLVAVHREPDRYERLLLRQDEGLLGASQRQKALKRLVDIVVSVVALAALAPVFIATAALIRLTSRGPVFHAQQRLGQHGRPMSFVKFRTMRWDATHLKESVAHLNECDGPVFKIREDPRVTRLGRLLRRFSIDELPQLFHVLRGELTLVGPRPPLPEETEHYQEWERQRMLVKPGITCLWQVSGRSDLPFSTWMELDIAYIREWTPALDAWILARTIPAVLSGRGAY